ncbi:MAG TPA: hypothetical protein VFP49_03710, partial [Nitrososphaeraceae archaeon]|nr:hypothetical protein [Nitrososphaeraceae archaeon]
VTLNNYYYSQEEDDKYEYVYNGRYIILRKKIKRSLWQRIKDFFRNLIYTVREVIIDFVVEEVIEYVFGPVVKFIYKVIDRMRNREIGRYEQVIHRSIHYVTDQYDRFFCVKNGNLYAVDLSKNLANIVSSNIKIHKHKGKRYYISNGYYLFLDDNDNVYVYQ